MCYMVPVGQGVRREYSDLFRSFTCCVGSGMESHAIHGYGIYYESGDRLWVNLSAPSTATWTAAALPAAGSSVEMKRTWKTGDTIALVLPKALHLDPMPDNPRRAAIMWGPLVLAGDLGPEPARGPGAPPVERPMLVSAERPVSDWLNAGGRQTGPLPQ